MRKYCVISALLALFAASACEKEIDLPVKADGGRLYLESFPDNGPGVTYISLAGARPVAEAEGPVGLEGVEVGFSVGGKAVEPEFLYEDSGLYVYSVDVPLETGDEVAITASAEGYPPVSSASVVPARADMEMTREVWNYGFLRHRFTIDRTGDPGEKRYYGVRIRAIRYMETSFADPSLAPEVEESVLEFDYEKSTNGKTVVQTKVNGRNMLVFEDDGGVTPRLEIIVDLPFDADMYRITTQEYKTYRRTVYNIETYRIGRGGYESLNPRVDQFLLGTGLVPPFISYGNVTGGYGIVSCMGMSETGWLANLDPM